MKEIIDNSVPEIWKNFIIGNDNYKSQKQPISFYFCDNKIDANDCADLVVKEIKQATATSLWWFDINNEKLPKVGNLYIITDWDGKAKAIIKTTRLEKTPYNEITADFALAEGEGDKSLEYWKKVHWEYYSREMKPFNAKPTNNMIIICEYFKTIWMDK